MFSDQSSDEEYLFNAFEGQGNNSLILHDDNSSNYVFPNIPVSTLLEDLATYRPSNPNPFIFYKVNELCQLPKNVLPRGKQVKTCGVYKTLKQRSFLVEPLQCEKEQEEHKLDVDFELVGDLPPVGRMIEVFGYMSFDDETKRVLFNVWFWRERTGNYEMMVELYLKHRTDFDNNKTMKTH